MTGDGCDVAVAVLLRRSHASLPLMSLFRTRYKVEYQWGWELYVLLRAPFPEYDETFVEYEQNKVQYAHELRAAGFKVVVVPSSTSSTPTWTRTRRRSRQGQNSTRAGLVSYCLCRTSKYVYTEVMRLFADSCVSNPLGSLARALQSVPNHYRTSDSLPPWLGDSAGIGATSLPRR